MERSVSSNDKIIVIGDINAGELIIKAYDAVCSLKGDSGITKTVEARPGIVCIMTYTIYGCIFENYGRSGCNVYLNDAAKCTGKNLAILGGIL